MPSSYGRENGLKTALTALIVGAVVFIAAMQALDVADWKRFAAYFVLIPVANICFAIALWLGIQELTTDR